MTQNALSQVKKTLYTLKDPEDAKHLMRFFKRGKGQYGEGDQFLGIRVPETRKIARAFCPLLNLEECRDLLHSPFHEERLLALFILVKKFKKDPHNVYSLYLNETAWINNWDLVDSSASHIVGAYLENRPRDPLYTLVKSANMWERRIAIIATFHFIKQGTFEDTLQLATLLLNDPHDLIHKAVGWMLREMGKKNQALLELFLDKHCLKMPRTMLRYAIEKFEEEKRQMYLQRKPHV